MKVEFNTQRLEITLTSDQEKALPLQQLKSSLQGLESDDTKLRQRIYSEQPTKSFQSNLGLNQYSKFEILQIF